MGVIQMTNGVDIFLQGLDNELNKTTTTNGAVAYRSTNSALLDFWAKAGAVGRKLDTDEKEAFVNLYMKAYAEDKNLALRMLFALRDVREGQGVRQLVKDIYAKLIKVDEETAVKLVALFAQYGRWDDILYSIPADGLYRNVLRSLLGNQIYLDVENAKKGLPISLLAKWLPTINSKNDNTKRKGRQISRLLKYDYMQYRKIVNFLREYLKITERLISQGRFEEIDYEKLPAKAKRKHHNTFLTFDELRYEQHIEGLANGTQRTNAGTVYPPELVESSIGYSVHDLGSQRFTIDKQSHKAKLNDAQYAEILKSIGSINKRLLPVADVSESMNSYGGYDGKDQKVRPIHVSLGLSMLLANKLEGAFHNVVMAYSKEPKLVKLQEGTFSEQLEDLGRNIPKAYGTNVEAVFTVLLQTAVQNHLTQEDMPEILVMFTDEQFDGNRSHVGNVTDTLFQTMKGLYGHAGYELPKIVYWNVNGTLSNNNVPVTKFEDNVILMSGFSHKLLEDIVYNAGKTPMEALLEVLMKDRYNLVTEALNS